MEISESTYLEHYGVKGMRWGVRKRTKMPSRREAVKVNEAIVRQRFLDHPKLYHHLHAKNKIMVAQGKDFSRILLGKEGRSTQKVLNSAIKEIAKREAKNEERRAAKAERQTTNVKVAGSSRPRDLQSRSQRRR